MVFPGRGFPAAGLFGGLSGSFAWKCWRAAAGAWRCAVTVRAGQAARGRRPAGSIEEIHPFLLAVPARGQVQGDVAASVPGDPGGDGDEVAADGRSAYSGADAVGEDA